MSDCAEVMVIVEGPTEMKFIHEVLAPFLAVKNVFLTPIILDKPGEKGGDVKFARAKNDIERHLKQRRDTFVTLLVDYYGIRGDWPGYQESKQQGTHAAKAGILNAATAAEVAGRVHADLRPDRRFIPYVSMHETEALYFSDPAALAEHLGVKTAKVEAILTECGEPEKINDHSETAPSKRLAKLSPHFKKTATGIAIAKEIGIAKMREKCPLFDAWVSRMEKLTQQTEEGLV